MIITRAALADVDIIMSWRRERVAWLAAKTTSQPYRGYLKTEGE